MPIITPFVIGILVCAHAVRGAERPHRRARPSACHGEKAITVLGRRRSMNSPAKRRSHEFAGMEGPMATKPQTLGWSAWTIVLIVLLILVVAMLYLAY